MHSREYHSKMTTHNPHARDLMSFHQPRPFLNAAGLLWHSLEGMKLLLTLIPHHIETGLKLFQFFLMI